MSEPKELEANPLADALVGLVKRALRRGRSEMGRAAEGSRRRLELRQMRKDLDHFWVRLGKTAHRLVEAGEIDHPGLRKAMVRIYELEVELDDALSHAGDLPESPPGSVASGDGAD